MFLKFSLWLCLQENTYYISNFLSLPEHCKIIFSKNIFKHNLFSNIQLWSGSTGFSAESIWTPLPILYSIILYYISSRLLCLQYNIPAFHEKFAKNDVSKKKVDSECGRAQISKHCFRWGQGFWHKNICRIHDIWNQMKTLQT